MSFRQQAASLPASETEKASSSKQTNVHELHFSIAEHGKLLALSNKYEDALSHYREAIRMAVSIKAPEVFFRHYTQCVLESLELTGSHDEVIEFCSNADAHYQKVEVQIPLHRKDHGATLERKGINELKAGTPELARQSFQAALEVTGPGVLPLTEELAGWISRGLTIDKARLLALQKKHDYFVVRKEQVDASRARSMDSLKKRPDFRRSSLAGAVAG